MNKITNRPAKNRSPWTWVPTLYFAEGIPNVVAATVSVIMYKRFGVSNTEITLYTSLLYLPWVLKFIWSPFIDIFKSKRWWIITMQLILAITLGIVALLIPTPFYFKSTLLVFWLMSFSSATHDIAADGFYMYALNSSDQSFFVGIRSTFYRLAAVTGQGILIIFAGLMEKQFHSIPKAWSLTFYILSAFFLLIFIYHNFILPKPATDIKQNDKTASEIFSEFKETFITFFSKEGIGVAIIFMLVYRIGEALLVKLTTPFLLDPRSAGGLGLSTEEVGIVYGTVGIIALTLGGIVGGIVASRQGLKFWIWPMALSITLPHLAYIYLAYAQPTHFILINAAVALEQFGYGFGFTAYMLFLIYFARGKHKTAHYAIGTAFMAAGLMFPGMIAGWLQEMMGYKHFFLMVILFTIPTLAVIPFLKIDKNFGKKNIDISPEESN